MNKTLKLMVAAAIGIAAQGANAACTDVSRAVLDLAVKAAACQGVATLVPPAGKTPANYTCAPSAVTSPSTGNTGGYGLPMWVTMVDETGKVCMVTVGGTWSGATYTASVSGVKAGNAEWLGSRVISAQKANTANAFSLDSYAISTANLYSAVQPGGSLFGLQESNPIDASRAYATTVASPAYGTSTDPLNNQRIGGVNVFGGGLALYKGVKKVGAIGVSGDTSCRDHAFAWKVRSVLAMEPSTGITNNNKDVSGNPPVPSKATGFASNTPKGDEMLIDAGGVGTDVYWKAWAQPACPNTAYGDGTAIGTVVLQ